MSFVLSNFGVINNEVVKRIYSFITGCSCVRAIG